MGTSRPREIRFYVHSIEVSLAGEQAAALANDFEFFTDPPQAGKPKYQVRLRCELRAPLPSDLPDCPATRIFPDCVLYREGRSYAYEYPGAVLWVERKGKVSSAVLFTRDMALQRELAYLYLQSEIGRWLDKQGLHRIHALGLGLPSGKAALLLLPSGGGKSTMALELLKSGSCVLLSDDSPLIDRRGNVYPYPLRLSFRPHTKIPESWRENAELFERRKYGPKVLVPLTALPRAAIPPRNAVFRPGFLVVGMRHGRNPSPCVKKTTALHGAFPLFRDLVVGLGIAQVAELVLADGMKGLPGLAPTALSRARAAAAYSARATTMQLRMSRDPREDARLLLSELVKY